MGQLSKGGDFKCSVEDVFVVVVVALLADVVVRSAVCGVESGLGFKVLCRVVGGDSVAPLFLNNWRVCT